MRDSPKVFRLLESRPTRARGLKRHEVVALPERQSVAPHAGAWIETFLRGTTMDQSSVAPHAGATKHSFVVRTNIAYEKSLTIFIVRP